MDTFQIKKPGYVDPKMTALCLTEICLCLNSPLWTKYIFLTEKKFKEKMSLTWAVKNPEISTGGPVFSSSSHQWSQLPFQIN